MTSRKRKKKKAVDKGFQNTRTRQKEREILYWRLLSKQQTVCLVGVSMLPPPPFGCKKIYFNSLPYLCLRVDVARGWWNDAARLVHYAVVKNGHIQHPGANIYCHSTLPEPASYTIWYAPPLSAYWNCLWEREEKCLVIDLPKTKEHRFIYSMISLLMYFALLKTILVVRK